MSKSPRGPEGGGGGYFLHCRRAHLVPLSDKLRLWKLVTEEQAHLPSHMMRSGSTGISEGVRNAFGVGLQRGTTVIRCTRELLLLKGNSPQLLNCAACDGEHCGLQGWRCHVPFCFQLPRLSKDPHLKTELVRAQLSLYSYVELLQCFCKVLHPVCLSDDWCTSVLNEIFVEEQFRTSCCPSLSRLLMSFTFRIV